MQRARCDTYRLAIFSLNSGWLRPLINLISFAISADMVKEIQGGGTPPSGDLTTRAFCFCFFLRAAQLLAGHCGCGAVAWVGCGAACCCAYLYRQPVGRAQEMATRQS